MEVQRNLFPKKEKLKSRKTIDLLFKNGKSFTAYPIRVMLMPKHAVENDVFISTGFSVPKRNIKRAVDRNLIKRKMREAYRLNNQALKLWLKENNKGLDLMFIYTSNQMYNYQEIEEKIKVILARLIETSEVVIK